MKSTKNKIRRQQVKSDQKVKLPTNLGCDKFKWSIQSNLLDWQHPIMGFNLSVIKSFIKIIKPRLDNYITMTWGELGKRKSCHPMDINKISFEMFNRLQELFGDEAPETLYQVDITPKHRVWGIKVDDVFCLLWNDEEHKVYPVWKKHT